MTEVQRRVLVMCEIHFYEVSMPPESFQSALQRYGWKVAPDFSKASIAQLQRLALRFRSDLRTNRS